MHEITWDLDIQCGTEIVVRVQSGDEGFCEGGVAIARSPSFGLS